MEQTQTMLDKTMAQSWFSSIQDKSNWQQTNRGADHIYTRSSGIGGNNQGGKDTQTGGKNTRGRDKLPETRVKFKTKNSKLQDNIDTRQHNQLSWPLQHV